MRPRAWSILTVIVAAGIVPGILLPSRSTDAMPTFGQAYGVKCSVCHTLVPELNSYGRSVQRSGYASLDEQTVNRALPIWIGESANYDATAGSGTGTPRYSFGNLALHASGFAGPDFTYHAQQFITVGDQSGNIDTLWVTYNNLLHRDGHLFIGKIENPAPSPYSQTFDLDGPSASSTLVGEHDWGATYGNRWGTKLAYAKKNFSAEAGYLWSSSDLSGATDFSPGDKTFQWKIAYGRANLPVEVGLFGSVGSVPLSTGLDEYSSYAPYIQIDPQKNGIPGLLAVSQWQSDNTPGVDSITGTVMPAVSSRGSSFELYEPLFRGNAVISARHDINFDGYRTVTVGNTLNFAANIPHFQYAHVYFETRLGGSSALLDTSNGPQWKAMLWLTFPIRKTR